MHLQFINNDVPYTVYIFYKFCLDTYYANVMVFMAIDLRDTL